MICILGPNGAGKSTLLKRVRNGGDSTAFVKVSVVELVYDGSAAPREVPLDGLALEQRGLAAYTSEKERSKRTPWV